MKSQTVGGGCVCLLLTQTDHQLILICFTHERGLLCSGRACRGGRAQALWFSPPRGTQTAVHVALAAAHPVRRHESVSESRCAECWRSTKRAGFFPSSIEKTNKNHLLPGLKLTEPLISHLRSGLVQKHLCFIEAMPSRSVIRC